MKEYSTPVSDVIRDLAKIGKKLSESLRCKSNNHFCILAFVLMLRLSVFAQGKDYNPDIIPPNPSTADLGSYGNVPIGMYNGTSNLNLDIYTLTEGSFSIPITAGYSSNGVQVDAVAKQLGMEWSLIAGGVISRQIYDEDDMDHSFYIPDLTGICQFNSPTGTAISTNGRDTQKDIFNYSAMGVSGRFVLDGGSIREIDPTKNKIETSVTDNGISYPFKITDISGTQYFFGGNANALETSNNISNCGNGHNIGGVKTTGWYLSKIKKTNGAIATFTYEKDAFQYHQYHQSALYILRDGIPISEYALLNAPCNSTEYHSTPFLTEININDKKITFEYQQLITGVNESKQLTRINAYAAPAIPYKSFEFSYYPISANKRVFLKDISEKPLTGDVIIKYAFDYYNKEDLPARNSYAKDLYGYYNAANNQNLIYNNVPPGLSFFYDAFKNITSNKEANPDVVYYGMLKHVIYATKGRTEFEYEPNSIYTDKWIYPPLVTHQAGAERGDLPTEVESETFTVPFAQTAVIRAQAELVLSPENDPEAGSCTLNQYPPHWTPFSLVYLINTATNSVVAYINSQYTAEQEINVPAGTYKLRVKCLKRCQQTYGSLTFRETAPYTIKINKPVAGVRVQRTTDYDDTGGSIVKRYYYAFLNTLEKSSGGFATINPEASLNIESVVTQGDLSSYNFKQTYSMSSEPMDPLYSFHGTLITYPSVVESFGENFENGGIAHLYTSTMDETPVSICGNEVRGRPYSNGFKGGDELKTEVFKKEGDNFIVVSSDRFTYTEAPSFYNAITNYAISTAAVLSAGGGSGTDAVYNIESYEIRTQRQYVSLKESVRYDVNGANPVETLTTYSYNNPSHLQLSSELSTSSLASENIEKKYFYPYDTEVAFEPNVGSLIAKNILGTPIKTQILKGGHLLSEQKTEFGSFTATDLLSPNLLPKFIYSAKFPNNNPVLPDGSTLDKKITFDIYDTAGNLIQYTPEGGVPVTFIWGYNNTKPVAKIEGLGYNSIPTNLIGNIKVASIDNDENALPAALNALRSDPVLAQAMVTTFTYIPLIGVSTVTDPKGNITRYFYDGFGRLETVKDNEGKIITQNEYHYKN